LFNAGEPMENQSSVKMSVVILLMHLLLITGWRASYLHLCLKNDCGSEMVLYCRLEGLVLFLYVLVSTQLMLCAGSIRNKSDSFFQSMCQSTFEGLKLPIVWMSHFPTYIVSAFLLKPHVVNIDQEIAWRREVVKEAEEDLDFYMRSRMKIHTDKCLQLIVELQEEINFLVQIEQDLCLFDTMLESLMNQ